MHPFIYIFVSIPIAKKKNSEVIIYQLERYTHQSSGTTYIRVSTIIILYPSRLSFFMMYMREGRREKSVALM
jgi:hypothetical protein